MLEILKEEGNGVLALPGYRIVYRYLTKPITRERNLYARKKTLFSSKDCMSATHFFHLNDFCLCLNAFCSCAYFLNCNHLQYLLFLFLFFFWTQLYFMYHHFRFVIYVLCFTFMFTDQILWSHWDVNFYKLSWPLRFRTFTALRRFRVSGHVYVHAEWRWSISGTCLS